MVRLSRGKVSRTAPRRMLLAVSVAAFVASLFLSMPAQANPSWAYRKASALRAHPLRTTAKALAFAAVLAPAADMVAHNGWVAVKGGFGMAATALGLPWGQHEARYSGQSWVDPSTGKRNKKLCAVPPGGAPQQGLATYYGTLTGLGDGLAFQTTSSGERLLPWRATAAHPIYPPGTIVRICTTGAEGACTLARINDTGPQALPRNGKPRIIDVNWWLGYKLDLHRPGAREVSVEVVAGVDRCKTKPSSP